MKKYTQRERLILSEVESWPDWKQGFFWSIVNDKKQSVLFAHMAASQEAPRSLTDSVMMGGQKRLSQLPDKIREQICIAAKKRGYNPQPTDAYMPTMAQGLGDPDAFFNHGEGLSKIRDVARRRKCESHGIIDCNYKQEPENDPRDHAPRLHKRIVNRIKKRMIEQDPDLKRKIPDREMNEMIVSKHARKK